MAIIIPSKNIFGIDNPKIIDNFIDNVSVSVSKIKDKIQYETPIYSKSAYSNRAPTTDYSQIVVDYKIDYTGDRGAYVLTTVAMYDKPQFVEVAVEFPVVSNNSHITPLEGTDKNKEPYIKYQLQGNEILYAAKSIEWEINLLGKEYPFPSYYVDLAISGSPEIDQGEPFETLFDGTLNIPNEISYTKTITPTANELNQQTLTSTANVKLGDISNLSQVKYEKITKDGVEYWKATFNVLRSIRVCKLFDYEYYSLGESKNGRFYGDIITYTANHMNISIYGNSVGIDIEQTEKSYGDGNHIFSLGGSELMQDAAPRIAYSIMSQYQFGKETAELRCSISKYYDQSGNEILSPSSSKMTFDVNDVVLPFVRGADGYDVPMSVVHGIYPKYFAVLGTKTIYDGSIKQVIYLQEYENDGETAISAGYDGTLKQIYVNEGLTADISNRSLIMRGGSVSYIYNKTLYIF